MSIEQGREISAAEITTMAHEIRRGLHLSESRVSMTDAHREVWNDLQAQLRLR